MKVMHIRNCTGFINKKALTGKRLRLRAGISSAVYYYTKLIFLNRITRHPDFLFYVQNYSNVLTPLILVAVCWCRSNTITSFLPVCNQFAGQYK
jgi:hypothetical protein